MRSTIALRVAAALALSTGLVAGGATAAYAIGGNPVCADAAVADPCVPVPGAASDPAPDPTQTPTQTPTPAPSQDTATSSSGHPRNSGSGPTTTTDGSGGTQTSTAPSSGGTQTSTGSSASAPDAPAQAPAQQAPAPAPAPGAPAPAPAAPAPAAGTGSSASAGSSSSTSAASPSSGRASSGSSSSSSSGSSVPESVTAAPAVPVAPEGPVLTQVQSRAATQALEKARKTLPTTVEPNTRLLAGNTSSKGSLIPSPDDSGLLALIVAMGVASAGFAVAAVVLRKRSRPRHVARS